MGVLSVLHALKNHCGKDAVWEPITDLQRDVLRTYEQARVQLDSGVEGVQTLVSDDSVRLNAVLAERGWNIRLPSFGPPNFGSVSLFKRAMTWLQPGEVKSIRLSSKETVAATKLLGGYDIYKNAQTETFEALKVRTTGADVVWLIPYVGTQLDGVGLLTAASARVKSLKEASDIEQGDDSGGFFPMVDLRHTPNISFLGGMRVNGERGGILGAVLQENILQMDEKGARVESATAAPLYRCASPIINGPFLFVLERVGLIDFVALCAEDSFRNPKSGSPLVLKDEDITAPTNEVPAVSIVNPPPTGSTRPLLQVKETATPVNHSDVFALFV